MTTRLALSASLLVLTACPKPPPDPVPADCEKPGQACADDPKPEGPPPIGTNPPAPK